MKFLIFGLGNPGVEYQDTRHNIGFKVLDFLSKEAGTFFIPDRHVEMCSVKHKGRTLILLKPQTFMNLSGKAVNYWMEKENVPAERILIVTDDLALPFGTLRMRGKGSDGGHNGLKSINEVLGGSNYTRLRFGIGSEFARGQQVNYVLSPWSATEEVALTTRIPFAAEMIKSFASIGLQQTMSNFNGQ